MPATLVLLGALAAAAVAQPVPPKSRYPVDARAIPSIQCDLCRAAIDAAIDQVAALEESKGKKPSTDEMSEVVQNLCQPRLQGGHWMRMLDLERSESGSHLVLAKQEYIGVCRSECETMAAACNQIFDDVDETEVGERLWKGTMSADKLKTLVCNKEAMVCSRKGPKRIYADWEDERWIPAPEDDVNMESMMAEMEALGINTHTYTPEDFLQGFADEFGDGDLEGNMFNDDFDYMMDEDYDFEAARQEMEERDEL